MKLRKILAGFLAGAVAMSSMMFSSVAASMDYPDGKTEIVEGSLLSESTTLAQWGSAWVQIYGLDASKHFTEDYAIKAVLTTDTVLGWGDNSDPISTFIGWGWSSYSGWINVVKAYDGTAVAGNTGVTYAPSLKSTDKEYVVYIPTTDFTPDSYIAFNLQNLMSAPATVTSVELVSFGSATAPELPEYAYEFDVATGSGAAWEQPAYTEVNDSAAVTVDTLAGDFIVAVPYTSDSKPNIVFSDGLGDSSSLNWIQVAPNCVVDGVAYYLKSDITAAWTAAGGSADFSEVVKILVAATASALEVTAPGAVLYSSVAPAAKTYTITIDSAIENGTVTATINDTAVTEAEAGASVVFTAIPNDGYEFDSESGFNISWIPADASAEGVFGYVNPYTLTMPAYDVTVTATFKAIEAEAVTLDRTTASILVGGTTTLVATVEPENALNTTVTWSSADTTIATVDQTGKVTGVAAGTATITAKCGDVYAECVVTITEEEVAVESITLDASEITTYVGITNTVTATVLPADATYESITWTSSDTSVATVANGKVTAVAAGTATITASIGDITASCTITVIPEGYDKAEADFAADTIVAQKSFNLDGTTNARFVKMVSKTSIEDKNLVTFTLSNGTATKTVEASEYYTALSASGTTVTAPDGYVFLSCTVTDIPEGVTVTCTDIAVSKK